MSERIYLLDGTYELFRHFYGAPKKKAPDQSEIGAVRGLLRSIIQILKAEAPQGAPILACAFDTQIESFRNELFEGYKDGTGIDPLLVEQFALAEEAVRALGVVVWSMIEFEADDALATAATQLMEDDKAGEIWLCSPDKDLAQCVVPGRVLLRDRRRDQTYDREDVQEKFGVYPESIPDYLALVGDSADGIPGLSRWGAKSTAAVLKRYTHIEEIPHDVASWDIKVRGAASLAKVLQEQHEDALLYRQLATLRTDAPIEASVDALTWQGTKTDAWNAICERIGDTKLAGQVPS